jgi:DNA (cytosine-5)-methyltransferase 1
MRIIDVFCGIGSYRISAEELGMRCAFACDIDPHAQKVYYRNFGMRPDSDIRTIDPVKVPDHDILCAGFPCSAGPRSSSKGKFDTVVQDRLDECVAEIVRVKRPRAFVFDNVRGFLSSNCGQDFGRFKSLINEIGYSLHHQIIKCEDFGIPQTKHRVFMVGFRDDRPDGGFAFPKGNASECPPLGEYLGLPIVKIFSNTVRCSGRKSGVDNTKNWSAYRLQDGNVVEFDLDHVKKLQGFPESFDLEDVPESQKWKLFGNTIPTCMTRIILQAVMNHLKRPAPPHPPVASSPIEDGCMSAMSKGEEKEETAEDEDEGDEEQSLIPEIPNKKRKRISAPTLAAEPTHKKTKPLPEKKEQPVLITIKSGAQMSFCLPDSMEQQTFVLRVIR